MRELEVDEHTNLKQIADSCMIASGGGKKLKKEEILEIFNMCF